MSDKRGHHNTAVVTRLTLGVLLLLPVLLLPLNSVADLSDPTRPLYLRKKPVATPKRKTVKPVVRPSTPPEHYTLTSTLVSRQRTVAVINHHVVAVGDKVGSATVVAIEPARVRLRKGTRDFTLWLSSQGVRKTVRKHGITNQQRLP